MSTEKFIASAQYDDWTGTAAADNSDVNDFKKYLVQKKLINSDEFLAGIEFYSSAPQGAQGGLQFSIQALLIKAKGGDEYTELVKKAKSIPCRKVDIEMDVKEFLTLFKRFSITISQNGLLEGREIQLNDA
ncbi:hypothetical protein [Yersinia enterocolitica]|uniref:hypothetical protein n=1 Tax=Yersinia enterocolitica TaxID=630 RepID=UPI003F44FD0F|nr:hypothetical protein [Yersinia enterocolitica]